MLEKIFGSAARVKMMRLFLFNSREHFDTAEIRSKTQLSGRAVAREITRLSNAGFIKQKNGMKEVCRTRGKEEKVVKKRVRGWMLNPNFPYLEAMKTLLISSKSFERSTIARRFQNGGRIKLLIISGVFLRNEQSRVDILVVGDNLKRVTIAQTLKAIESSVGKELRYAIMKTDDFLYRMSIYDKFIRDILDYPHERLIDKIGL